MNITSSNLVRSTGLAAMGAGILFIAIQPIHPPDVLASVTTTTWLVVHVVAVLMSLFGMLGVTGLYARQANKAGWLGLVGYLLFALFWAITLIFQFNEAFLIPAIASVAPEFVEGHLGIVTSTPSAVDLGAIPVIYMVNGLLYALGGLLFGIATFRAQILPRWGGALLAMGAVAPFVLSMLPHPLDRSFAVPMGLALAWLGYALWAERHETTASNVNVMKNRQLNPSAAK